MLFTLKVKTSRTLTERASIDVAEPLRRKEVALPPCLVSRGLNRSERLAQT